MATTTYRNNTGVKISGASLDKLREDLLLLADAEVLVGVPDENADRDPDPAVGREPTNATLAYIHDQGAPEANIPQREFMRPGVVSVVPKLEQKLSDTMRAVLRGGGAAKVEQGLTQVGIIAAVAIQTFVNDGVPPPLSEYTLKQRTRKGRKSGGGARKGAAMELANRAKGMPASVEHAKPLVDTAQLRNAITFAIRSRKKRGK